MTNTKTFVFDFSEDINQTVQLQTVMQFFSVQGQQLLFIEIVRYYEISLLSRKPTEACIILS